MILNGGGGVRGSLAPEMMSELRPEGSEGSSWVDGCPSHTSGVTSSGRVSLGS